MRRGLLLVGLLAACEGSTEPSPDAATDASTDASAGDAETQDALPDGGSVDGGEGDVFDHCPPASAYVGDSTWTSTLETGGALFCVYPRRDDLPADALARKQRLKLVEGSFAFPTAATDAPFRIPACIERKDAAPPEILEGTVTAARRISFEDNVERTFVDATFPLANGGSAGLFFRAELDQTTISLAGTISDFMLASMTLCQSGSCAPRMDQFLAPCRLTSNTCDEFTFDGGMIQIDQFHWAGQVGSGFAAPVRLRGELDGVPFDIASYEQMTVTYGHHAFLRALTMFFDAPIGSACGLEMDEIAESSLSDVHLIDCNGVRIGMRDVSAQNHRWTEPCP